MNVKSIFLIVFFTVLLCCFTGLAQAERLVIGNGASKQEDTTAAITQAVSQAAEKLGDRKVSFVIVVTSIGYEYEKILTGLKGAYGKDVKIWGLTSHMGVMTGNGWQKGKNLSIMAFATDAMQFGVGGEVIGPDPKASAVTAVKRALEDAKRPKQQKPKLVLLTSSFGAEEQLIEGVEEVLGPEVFIFGGSSGDDELAGLWRQLSTDVVYQNGVVATVIYSDLKIGTMFGSGVGYVPSTKTGVVTRAEGRTIYEIDNKPAGEVYNRWLDGDLNEKLENGGSLMFEGILDPLTQTVKTSTGSTINMTIHAVSLNKEDKSLTALAETQNGQPISILHGSPDTHFNRPPIVAVMARTSGRIAPDEIAGTLFLCCACTYMVLEDQVDGFIPMMNKVLNNKPFLGAFTFGEQGMVPGLGNRHQNLITNILVFGN